MSRNNGTPIQRSGHINIDPGELPGVVAAISCVASGGILAAWRLVQ